MDISSILKQSGAIGAIAQQLGVNEQVAQMGAEALLPSILGGFKKTTQAQPTGLGGLGGLCWGSLAVAGYSIRLWHPNLRQLNRAMAYWGKYLAPKMSAARLPDMLPAKQALILQC